MRRAAVAVAALVAGCIESSSVTCGNGSDQRLCPSNTTCAVVAGKTECATADQLAQCEGKTEGSNCAADVAPAGACHDQVCITIACGNGLLDPGETCDDGNTITGDLTCSGDCQSTEKCGNHMLDPLKLTSTGGEELNEQCDDGNGLSHDGCTASCELEAPAWAQLYYDSADSIAGGTMAYDSARNRVVMFGGTDGFAPTDHTWEWDGAGWSRVQTFAMPSPRIAVALAYDQRRRKIVLFGGTGGSSTFDDTWEWDGEHWTRLRPTTVPPPRSGAAMAYAPALHEVVMFGGAATSNSSLDDTWAWDGTDWHAITATPHPAARFGHRMAYDPVRDVVVMAGGQAAQGQPTLDTWEISGSTWTSVASQANTPGDLLDAGMAYDAVGHRVLAFGGQQGGSTTANTWAWNGQQWTMLTPAGFPTSRTNFAMTSDPTAGEILVYGGAHFVNGCGACGGLRTDLWRWNGATWNAPTVVSPPAATIGAASAYDALRATMVMFGGLSPAATNETWELADGHWRPFSGAAPGARTGAALAYDSKRHLSLLFGGAQDFYGTSPTADTWTWSGNAWMSLTLSGTPSARSGHVMAYDVARDRIVLFGGLGASGELGDTWEWNGSAWSQRTPAASPSPRASAAMFYDPLTQHVLLFGGAAGGAELADTWQWDGTTWTDLKPLSPPSQRSHAAVAWDGARGAALLVGGLSGDATLPDVWEWNGTDWHLNIVPNPLPGREGHVMFPSRNGDAIVVFSGSNGSDMWRLRYDGTQPNEICTANIDADGDGLAGCADPDCWATCTPLCAPGMTCDPQAPHCGDGVCNAALENCRICPQDCGACSAVCGDSFCDSPETLASCPGDCTP